MSLDLYFENAVAPGPGTGIFVRENGSNRELTRAEWDERCPGMEPVIAVRDDDAREVASFNITHNLTKMAAAAGIYDVLWHPEENGFVHAGQMVKPLEAGLSKLRADPAKFRKHNSPNGWGTYENFVDFVSRVLVTAKEHPSAMVRTWS